MLSIFDRCPVSQNSNCRESKPGEPYAVRSRRFVIRPRSCDGGCPVPELPGGQGPGVLRDVASLTSDGRRVTVDAMDIDK